MTAFKKKSNIGGLRINRKAGDKISVNKGEMVIEVTEVRGNRVKLTFLASKEISIKRFEAV